MSIESLLPATAVVAIVLFTAREMLEAKRRADTKKRTLRGLKRLFSRECELNYWASHRIGEILGDVNRLASENRLRDIRVEERPVGGPYVVLRDDQGDVQMAPIPEVHRDELNKRLVETASLEDSLFECYESVLDRLAELENVRMQLAFGAGNAPLSREDFLKGLAGYGLAVVERTEAALRRLYKECTGEELTQWRLR